jgi:hypothetical protein
MSRKKAMMEFAQRYNFFTIKTRVVTKFVQNGALVEKHYK